MVDDELEFEVGTPLGFSVRVTCRYWQVITRVKHPVMQDQQVSVRHALEHPDEVRESRGDRSVYLFYREQHSRRWICAVAKRLNGDGFLITAYPTDAIKEGITIWTK